MTTRSPASGERVYVAGFPATVAHLDRECSSLRGRPRLAQLDEYRRLRLCQRCVTRRIAR